MLLYQTIEELLAAAAAQNKKISEIVLADQAAQMEKTEQEV